MKPSPRKCAEWLSVQLRQTGYPAYADRVDELVAENLELRAIITERMTKDLGVAEVTTNVADATTVAKAALWDQWEPWIKQNLRKFNVATQDDVFCMVCQVAPMCTGKPGCVAISNDT